MTGLPMLRSARELEGYAVDATDGEIGKVDDFYFDDRAWVIRYVVVDAGTWPSSRKVLISPVAIGRPVRRERQLQVWLTKNQIVGSPPIDVDPPVSRQHAVVRNQVVPETADASALPDIERNECTVGDRHLRSCREVMTYHIHATDGHLGCVYDLLIDDHSWAIHYLVVDTGPWWFGHRVLIAWSWVAEVSWGDAQVSMKTDRQAIKNAPSYDAGRQLERIDEERHHDHHRQRGYWANDPILKSESRV